MRLPDEPNGCGPKWAPWWPDCGLTWACQIHDREYQAGGTERDRWRVEWRFLMNGLAEARLVGSWRSRFMALLNSSLTFFFGWSSWNYRFKRPGQHADPVVDLDDLPPFED